MRKNEEKAIYQTQLNTFAEKTTNLFKEKKTKFDRL